MKRIRGNWEKNHIILENFRTPQNLDKFRKKIRTFLFTDRRFVNSIVWMVFGPKWCVVVQGWPIVATMTRGMVDLKLRWGLRWMPQLTDRQLASLTAHCRQVYCLVEMACSAPSWRPPHQRGGFNGFPGRREQPNLCRHTTIVSGLFNITNPQKKSQTSDPFLNQPTRQSLASCPSRPNSSRKFTNLNNNLIRVLEPKEWRNKRIDISLCIGIRNQHVAENNELNRAESEHSKR
jgi:hypothetical protein